MGDFSLGTAFDDLVLELADGPRVLFVPTPAAYPETTLVSFYSSFARRAEPSHLVFNPWPPAGLRQLALAQDAIYVSGGNTANALAIWRVHGFDAILREAWERGVLLCGWSAGMICWFEAGVTDSFGPQLAGLRDGLGFLPGSACPHYDGEERRRPVYTELVRDGFPPGIACDDGAAAYFEGTELVEIVACEPGARAYRVGPEGEEPLEARLLSTALDEADPDARHVADLLDGTPGAYERAQQGLAQAREGRTRPLDGL
jgi:dipeptidase E